MIRSLSVLIMMVALLGFVLPATPVEAGCWECDKTALLCRECDSSQSNTKNCVNKHPRCTGCIESSDSNCGGCDEEPCTDPEEQGLRFDMPRGEWVMATQDVQEPASEPGQEHVLDCGPRPAYSIY